MSYAMLYADGNSHWITTGAVRAEDGEPLTNATVSARIYEEDAETLVPGINWPLTLEHEGDGVYGVELSHEIELHVGRKYLLLVTATKDATRGSWYRWIPCLKRNLWN